MHHDLAVEQFVQNTIKVKALGEAVGVDRRFDTRVWLDVSIAVVHPALSEPSGQ